MLTDTANFRNHRYHCYRGIDDVEPLDHAFATSVIRAAVTAAADALVLRPPGP
jgi:hypothetical protein